MQVPDLIIDLSPIVRLINHESRWSLVEDSVQAWRAKFKSNANFFGVADNSLWYKLDEEGREQFSRWRRGQRARSVPWADPEVLELASKFPNAQVLTTDLYRDHRRNHPWLQGSDRFWKPVLTPDGIEFSRLDFSPIPAELESEYMEKAELTPKGFTTPESKKALHYEWKCSKSNCLWGQRPSIEEDPAFKNGQVVCPQCKSVVDRLGRRSSTIELVIESSGTEIERLPLAENTELIFGRVRDKDRFDLREILEVSESSRVSRNHFRISNSSGRVFVEDLGSKNGTELIRVDNSKTQLLKEVPQLLKLGEHLSLIGGKLKIRISGKKRPRGIYQTNFSLPPFVK